MTGPCLGGAGMWQKEAGPFAAQLRCGEEGASWTCCDCACVTCFPVQVR